ncbi:MAG: Gfo/Idh/MocA family oxidoreductase [Armatimonadetes bacterium]|nr:Gfo/Idh/MocA family oxidoreductase [Armatimonadota bacterium]
MDDQVRIGFVGTGGITKWSHFPALKEIEGVEIAGLYDVSETRAQEAASEFGGTVYADYRTMLDEAELDALFVCVPPFAHTDVEVLAAERKIHLFVEKPVVLDLEQGIRIAEAIDRSGIVSCVGYQLRYTPVAAAARQFLADKQVALVAGNRWGSVPGDENHWWRVLERSGGMFHEMATHNMDAIRYVVGEVASVYARYSSTVLGDLPNLTVPDGQVIVMEFKNGATGYFSTSCALTKGGGWASTSFILRDMMLQMSHDGLTIQPEGAATITLPDAGPSMHESFVHAVRTGDRSVIRSDYADALKTAEVTLGANESARRGKSVQMKLV